MKNPERVLFGTLFCLLVGGSALLFFQGGGEPPVHSDEAPTLPPSRPDPGRSVTPVIRDTDPVPASRSEGPPRESGTIGGSISMTAEIALNVEHFTIAIREAVNPDARVRGTAQPFNVRRTFTTLQEAGTPTFEIGDIPFSEYGYTVSAIVPDHNGDEQYVQVTRENPVARVHLGLRGGVEYSVLVRDQERNPLPRLEVHMVPRGEPVGRKSFSGVTDSYGAVLFEKVLKGVYRLSVGPTTSPLVEPKEVVVAPSGLQAQHVEVPRGVSVSFFVTAPGGLGLSNVGVDATVIDRPQFKRHETVTDTFGNAVFKHLTPGMYHVDFKAHGFVRRTERIEVKLDEAQPARTIELVHAR